MSSQKSVDDLFDQLTSSPGESKAAESPAKANTNADAGIGNIIKPEANNEKSERDAQNLILKKRELKEIPTGVWGSRKDPPFILVSDALEDRLYQTQKRLRVNEDLMMTYLFREGINEAYYRLWRQDANSLFRSVITAKHRLAVERKKEKA